jgi:hypothetical protein
MDLFRYSSPGVRDFTDGRDGKAIFFSADSNVLSTPSFNSEYSERGFRVNANDVADFTELDVFGAGTPGETNTLSSTDIAVMAALGWNTSQMNTGPAILSIATSGSGIVSGSGDLNAGKVVTFTVTVSGFVAVTGAPSLVLNDGGTAAYVEGSGGAALTFTYTVLAGQNTPDLAVSSLSLNGGTIQDGAGNNADLSGVINYNPAGTLQVDTTAPTVASIATSGSGIVNGSGDLSAGKVVTFAVTMSEAVTVMGAPSLVLNDRGVAGYVGGSGSAALTFSYAVLAGQNTLDLSVSSLSLNGGTIQDGAGNNADLSGAANNTLAGTLQVDTTATVVVSISAIDAVKVDGQSGTTPFTFTVSLDQTPVTSQTVDWVVTGSGPNPANASDFGGTLPSGTLTFAPGQTSETITLQVLGTKTAKSDEGFTVTLSDASSGLTIGTGAASGTILHLVAHDDAYIVPQDYRLIAPAADSLLFNDDNATTATLDIGPSHGNLQLNTDGSFSYTPTADFAGIDSFSYHASNGSSSGDAEALLYVVPTQGTATPTLNLQALDAEEQITATYTAFFSRGADADGFQFWVRLFNAALPTEGAAVLFANIANSFEVSNEAKALYPFLANPQGASDNQISSFLDTVYNNLFNRSSDPGGLAYWTSQIKQTMAANGFVSSVLVNIISGTQAGLDLQALMGKVAVSLEYVHQQMQYQVQYNGMTDQAPATALLHGITSDPQTVLVGIKQADQLIATHS